MATEYPVPAHRRVHLGRTTEFSTAPQSYDSTFTVTDVGVSALEAVDSAKYQGTPLAIPAGGGLLLQFKVPTNLHGYLIDLVSGAEPVIQITRDATPDLASGNWLEFGTAVETPVADYRSPVVIPISGITALRFQFTGTAEVGNLHLYASPTQPRPVRVVLADGNTPAPANHFNFGTGGKDGFKDVRFRLANHSGRESNMGLEFLIDVDAETGPSLLDELFLSVDGGVTFTSLRSAPSPLFPAPVPVGSLSPICVLRRYSPAEHTNGTPYVIPAVGFGTDAEESFHVYVGDVDPLKPDTQLWSAVPALARPGETVTLTVAGAGDSASEFKTQVAMVGANGSPTAMTLGTWTNVSADPALAGDPAVVDVIDRRSRTFEPKHQQIVVTVPPAAAPGVYLIQLVVGPEGGRTVSNTASLRVNTTLAQVPTPYDGFRLRATKLDGTVLASNVPYVELSFTDELSEVGHGNVTLDYQNEKFWAANPEFTPKYISENELVWEVWEGDEHRFSFFNQLSKTTVVDTSLSYESEIEGDGNTSGLGWSVVLPPKFPTVPPYYWSFAHARLWQWLTIWAECQSRSAINSVQRRLIPTFTRYTDSAGNEWKDPGFENQQPNGVTMLDLLRQHCDAVGADFHVTPDFKIDVMYSRSTIDIPGQYFGTDRQQVIFRVAQVSNKIVTRDRSDVGNWIIAQDEYGDVSLKYDTPSIVKNGHRERYVEAGRSGLLATRLSKAEEELKWHRDQVLSQELTVEHYYVTRSGETYNRAFVDYQVGDWIYLDVEGSTSLVSVQINAITLKVNEEGGVAVELTLESLASLRKRKAELAESVSNGSGSGGGGGIMVLFEEEIFPVQSETPPTTYEIKYLPLPKSEIITLGMRKYMEVSSSGALDVREFTRTLRRGEHWERTGWTVTITDPSVFDEAF